MSLVYPLAWPFGWQRTAAAERRHAAFDRNWTLARSRDEVLEELRRLARPMKTKAPEVRITSDVPVTLAGFPREGRRAPEDPGVAVWFTLGGRELVLACDRWIALPHNLHAIALHVASIRGQERWGVGSVERAFSAYQALPAAGETSREDPWAVLGIEDDYRAECLADPRYGRELVRSMFRELVPKGDPGPEAKRLIVARDQVLAELAAREVSA